MTRARDIANLLGSNTNGIIDNAKITLDAAEVPNLATSKITSGTFVDARLPSTALNSNVDLTNLSASNLTSGTLPDARFPATLPSISGANLTNLPSGGITEADMWRTTTDTAGASGTFSSNWERVDTYSFSHLGTGMSQSSGIFTFPSTGFYRISFQSNFTGTSIQYAGLILMLTTNNSSYNQHVKQYTSLGNSSYETSLSLEGIVDITNVSTHKVRFDQQQSAGGGVWAGGSSNRTSATFIRLGDT